MAKTDPDRILSARITATAWRYARCRTLTPEQEAEAVAELRQLAGNRPDLLAECAGTAIGFGEHQLDADCYRVVADLCVKAGADKPMIEEWIPVGQGRAEHASVRPATSGRRHP